MDEIQQRLRDTTDACLKSLENWHAQGKDMESREALMDSIHEVRKVCARLEIEIAISERDRLGSRPLPIPPHRSSMKGNGESAGNGDDGEGFDAGSFQLQGGQRDGGPRRMQQGGRNRRPMQGGGGRPNRGGSQQNNDASDNAGNAAPSEE